MQASALDPQKKKYWNLYWHIADIAAKQSIATRLQVGATIVTKTGMIGIGWNGMPPGFKELPEEHTADGLKTRPEVIHAERNAIDKLTRQGVSTLDSIIFITHSPCIECAKSLHTIGVKQVHFDQQYHSDMGLLYLMEAGVEVLQRSSYAND